MRLTNWRAIQNQEMGAKIRKALKPSEKQDFPATGEKLSGAVTDSLQGGWQPNTKNKAVAAAQPISDIANTEPSPVSTSLAVANQGEASEGPERAGHKPLMRNPGEMAAPRQAYTASDTLSELDPACDGWGNLWEEVGKAFFGKVPLILLCLLLVACQPSSAHLKEVAEQGQMLILTDKGGRVYAARHLDRDTWELKETR